MTNSFNVFIAVRIDSLNGIEESFKGILLEAKTLLTDDIVGSWGIPSSSDYITISCNNPDDAITHSARTIKTTPVIFTWNAPAVAVGPVVFT